MKKQTKIYAALALSGALSVLSVAKADILATYDFTGQTGLQVSTVADFSAANVTAGSITRGANYASAGSSTAFTQNGMAFMPGMANSDAAFLALDYTEATAVANDGYFEFSLTVDSGYELDVSSVTFGARRASNSTGPNNLAIRSSLDGFTTTLASLVNLTGTAADPREVVFDLGENVQSVSGTVIFRVYGYDRNRDDTAAGSPSYGILTISSDSFSPFTINGEVSVVPEPNAFALGLGVAAVGVAGLRRRRR